jgi:hypothetical protein
MRTVAVMDAALIDYWPCACVKRNSMGRMTKIKLNHPSRNKCRVCGTKRDTKFHPRIEALLE